MLLDKAGIQSTTIDDNRSCAGKVEKYTSGCRWHVNIFAQKLMIQDFFLEVFTFLTEVNKKT